jgi:hypothetical protein
VAGWPRLALALACLLAAAPIQAKDGTGGRHGDAMPAATPTRHPDLEQRRFDLQLTVPLDLARPVDIIALGLFDTAPERLQQLRARGTTTLCHMSAGLWETWRRDAPRFPETALGRSPTGWPGERWLDVREPALRPLLERRLDLCRARGFDGVLLAHLDGHGRDTGFAIQPEQQLAFNRWLAEAAHARGLVAGIMGDLGQAAELASAFDLLVADSCDPGSDCATAVRAFLAAGKPVHLVAYTNTTRRMDALCAFAAELGAPLIFKTQFLNGKLHRRCP